MSEQLRESLSAAMDDEADAFELRRVLDEATQDEALKDQWHRFHMVRDLLKDQAGTFEPGLRESLFEALIHTDSQDAQEEPLLVAGEAEAQKTGRSPWLGRLAGTAVAASVAILVMVNGGVFEDSPAPSFTSAEGNSLPISSNAGAPLPVMYPQATSADMQRQNGLILHHLQQRAMNQRSVASFVKVATFRGSSNPVNAPTRNSREADSRP